MQPNWQMNASSKASSSDLLGRFREIVSDPINLLIERVPQAGFVEDNLVCLHNGNRVQFSGKDAYYEGFSDILVINRGVHEPLEEFAFQECLKVLPQFPSMLELGAYWAHYSMWLKKKRPGAAVTMVEPDADNLRVGSANFKLNNYQGEFRQAFVGKDHFEVDAFLESRDASHLDILHSDIQGFEVEMLDGASRSLSQNKVNYLFISTHSQELHYEVANKLKSLNYRIEISSDFEFETTSYDGLVFASSPLVAPVLDDHLPFGRCDIPGLAPADLVARLRRFLP
ncbi:conserved protein of unknown function [Methylocella tundrae]|uniref:Methyltransferase FkbM domain-containing protein n=1 Tax=Methylocella tundrae TaxID=227605 RepID=A0A4U8YW47_METTU|nr:conserved protein of unknown function [Methylocella tundrae]